MAAKIVAAPLLELGEETRRPVRLPRRIVDLIGVVEEGAQATKRVSAEGAIERHEIRLDRVGGKVIDDEAFPAWRGALHQLAVPRAEKRVERPAPLWCGPLQVPVRLNARGQVHAVAAVRIRHEHDEWEVARILELLESQ
jgi:hypothetical protein